MLLHDCYRTSITVSTAAAASHAFVLMLILTTTSMIVNNNNSSNSNSSSRSSLRNIFVGSLAFSSSALSSSSTIRRASRSLAHSNKKSNHNDNDNDNDAPPAIRVLEVCIPLPLGMILEELDAQDPTQGIGIQRIQPGSHAARARATYTTATVTDTEDGPPPGCCVGDKIVAVNGDPACGTNFETMMARIRDSPYRQDPDTTTTTTTPDPDSTAATVVTLTLQRNLNAVLVTWPNGIVVNAAVGDYLGNVAQRASYHHEIPYECRAGSCGVCAQWVRTNNSPTPKLVRPCRATIPKGIATLQILRKKP